MGRASKGTHVVAKLRQELGLHQKELADKVGLHYRTIQDIERGRLELSRRNAMRISEKTGVSVNWLLTNDAKRPIRNVFEKRWSAKDRQAFESHSKRWPSIPPEIRRWQLSVWADLLEDCLALRSLIAGLPNPIEAIEKWRDCADHAMIQYLKSYPPAREQAKKMAPPIEDYRNEESSPGFKPPELMWLHSHLRQGVFTRLALQSVKDDLEAMLDNFGKPQDEVAEAVADSLSLGFYNLEQVLEILDGMTEENKEEKLLKLYGLVKLGDSREKRAKFKRHLYGTSSKS